MVSNRAILFGLLVTLACGSGGGDDDEDPTVPESEDPAESEGGESSSDASSPPPPDPSPPEPGVDAGSEPPPTEPPPETPPDEGEDPHPDPPPAEEWSDVDKCNQMCGNYCAKRQLCDGTPEAACRDAIDADNGGPCEGRGDTFAGISQEQVEDCIEAIQTMSCADFLEMFNTGSGVPGACQGILN